MEHPTTKDGLKTGWLQADGEDIFHSFPLGRYLSCFSVGKMCDGRQVQRLEAGRAK